MTLGKGKVTPILGLVTRHRLQLLGKHPLAEEAKLITWTNSGANSWSGHLTLSDKNVQSSAVAADQNTFQLSKERKQFWISWMTMSAKTKETQHTG